MDLAPATVKQQELEFDEVGTKDMHRLMSAIDAINDRFGPARVNLRWERGCCQYRASMVDASGTADTAVHNKVE